MIDAVVTGLAGIILGYFVLPSVVEKTGVSEYVGYKIGQYEYEKSERIRREKEALDIYNERKEEAISVFITDLTSYFSHDLDFCYNNIKSTYETDNNVISNFIDRVNKSENIENILNFRINNILDKLSNKMSKLEVNHLNILLVGPSGVGKSFLINTLLQLDERKKADTRASKPTTKTFNIYESNKVPKIRLIDSRGIEKGNYNVENFVNEITNFVEEQELKGNPDFFVHCIWYCVTGTRFEDIEEETLSRLSSIYDDSKLPIIVVYTQAMVPEYYEAIKNEVYKIKKNFDYIPVVAKDIKLADGSTVKPKNLDKLLINSLEKSKNAVYSSVFSSLKKNIYNETDNQIEMSINKINEDLKQYTLYNGEITMLSKFNEEENYNYIFKSLLYGEEKKDIKDETKKIIINFIQQFGKKNEKIINNCLSEYVDEKSNKLSSELIDIQTQVNQEKEGNLKNMKNKKQITKIVNPIIKNSIINYAKDIGFLNYVKVVPEKIIEKLTEKIKNQFNYIINESSTKNILNNKIKEQFQKILTTIKNFKF